jgi:Protein of unknown function (DUF3500)
MFVSAHPPAISPTFFPFPGSVSPHDGEMYHRLPRLSLQSCLQVAAAVSFLSPSALRAHQPPAEAMAQAAKTFLTSLDDGQKAKATYKLTDDERLNWHFIPRERMGLRLSEMNGGQRHLAYALLGSGLSDDGFSKATTIMSLEQILREMESDPVKRDPEKYHFTIFGEPGSASWAWRCEGHHCSVNMTTADGKISGTPSFFGTNPGEVKAGQRQGLRVLGGEEDTGRALLKTLSAEQKQAAILPGEAPKEVLSEAQKKVTPLPDQGITFSALTPAQQTALKELISLYLGRMEAPVVEGELKQIGEAGWEKVRFAWMGGEERGQPHYYRIQGPTFLIEYDNTQNGANHPHAVWRDFAGDFGADLLGEHLKAEHGTK